MPAVNHYLTWLEAMRTEAARLRHREVEPEHMLLGLLAQGGTAAAVLAAQGVTLARARAAVDEMTDTDLARVGISLFDTLRPVPIATEELAVRAGEEIPLSDAAAQLIDSKGTSLSTSAPVWPPCSVTRTGSRGGFCPDSSWLRFSPTGPCRGWRGAAEPAS